MSARDIPDNELPYMKCDECGEDLDEDEVRKNDEPEHPLCDFCNGRLLRAEAMDRMLDDPRHGQAASLNREYE